MGKCGFLTPRCRQATCVFRRRVQSVNVLETVLHVRRAFWSPHIGSSSSSYRDDDGSSLCALYILALVHSEPLISCKRVMEIWHESHRERSAPSPGKTDPDPSVCWCGRALGFFLQFLAAILKVYFLIYRKRQIDSRLSLWSSILAYITIHLSIWIYDGVVPFVVRSLPHHRLSMAIQDIGHGMYTCGCMEFLFFRPRIFFLKSSMTVKNNSTVYSLFF